MVNNMNEKIVLKNNEWTFILNSMSVILLNTKSTTSRQVSDNNIIITDSIYLEDRNDIVECSVIIDIKGCKRIMKETDRNADDFSEIEWTEYISGELKYIGDNELFIELVRDSFRVTATLNGVEIDIDHVLYEDESMITLDNMGCTIDDFK